MTPEEVADTSAIGLMIMQDVGLIIVLSSVFIGIYCLTFCISLYIYLRDKNTGVAKKAMFSVLFGTFVLMLMVFVSNVGLLFDLVKHYLVLSLPGGIREQIAASTMQSQILVYAKMQNWLQKYYSEFGEPYTEGLIADGVIAWRAWAVWMDNKKVKWTLFVLMFADIAPTPGVSLADAVATDIGYDHQDLSQSQILDGVTFVLSLSVNMVATCLIAFRAWTHHKSMRSILIRRKRSKVHILPHGLNPVAIFILVQTKNTYEQSFHLEEVPTLSQQLQSQQISNSLNPSDVTADASQTDQETNTIGFSIVRYSREH
ncbi:hypothetical protein BDP27DRAFT_1367561 [Rhodocollybia butyracea]|uniref:Uncharacterized protein n=1 Tax=Rhodocollybia butyracea TaxID=206335 RepID=A0A9P5PIR4_9AGAR|nr:hypothetical protein BDP27DRAFT_1367561 [Rhodocollybia butyracea]